MVRDREWNNFKYEFISIKPSPAFGILKIAGVHAINSFYILESLKEVYGIIWMLLPILILILGIAIGVLVTVWLERETTYWT